MLETFTLSTFLPHVHQSFQIQGGSSVLDTELVEAKAIGIEFSNRRAPFTLLFRAAYPPVWIQNTYTVIHPALGSFELFLVPVGPDPKSPGGMLYEAVFS